MELTNGRPVLVPVDFSESSARALKWAGAFVAWLGAPLIVLHVIHHIAPGSYVRTDEGDFERYEQAAEEMMNVFVDQASQQQPSIQEAERLIVAGLPVTRILEVAQTRDAQHIVMGSHGRTGLSHLLLGSKAERVVQLSPIPVTIVKRETPGSDS